MPTYGIVEWRGSIVDKRLSISGYFRPIGTLEDAGKARLEALNSDRKVLQVEIVEIEEGGI